MNYTLYHFSGTIQNVNHHHKIMKQDFMQIMQNRSQFKEKKLFLKQKEILIYCDDLSYANFLKISVKLPKINPMKKVA